MRVGGRLPGRCRGRGFFHGLHEAQEIGSVDLADVGGGVAAFQKFSRQVGPLRDVFQPGGDASDAIEVAAETDGVDPGNGADVVDVRDDVVDCRLVVLCRQEFVDGGLTLGGIRDGCSGVGGLLGDRWI